MSKDIQRVAIVTGGARGIGAAICRRLAADGRAVAVVDLRKADCSAVVSEIEELGGAAAAFEADVSDEAASQAAVDAVAATLGPPTILVNNAGITRDNLLFKMSTTDWTSVMDVHLKGAFLMSRATQKHMVEARYGRIVNLSSTSALGNRGQANYAAAKAGLQGFTKTLAIELGPFGITVNSVAPGFVETDMTAATAERMGIPWDEFRRRAIERIPVGRGGRPEDIAAAVGFFASDDASYISGQVLYAAGGPRA